MGHNYFRSDKGSDQNYDFFDWKLIKLDDGDLTVKGRIPRYGFTNGNAYYLGEKIEGVDMDSYQVFDKYYDGKISADKNYVYRENIPLDLDRASFSMINHAYMRDATRIFGGSEEIEGVDAATFEVIGWGFAKDSSRVYVWGSALNVNPLTVEYLGPGLLPIKMGSMEPIVQEFTP